MQKYLFIILLFICSSLIASSKINDLNVYIYPEYYYSGVMVEINGKINLPDSSFSMKMLVVFIVPNNTKYHVVLFKNLNPGSIHL